MRHLALLAALATAAGAAPHRTVASARVLAVGTGVRIDAAALAARLNELPSPRRSRYTSREAKRELLESMIRFELVAREAEAQGLADDPDVRARGRQLMVQKLVQRKFHDPAGPSRVPESEVARYYQSHLAEFVQPARMRVSHLFLSAPEGSPSRAARRAEAGRLRERIVKEEEKDPGAFARAARDLSDDEASKRQGGYIGLKSREDLARELSGEIADAAWKVEGNRTSPVYSSPRGFHLVKFSGGKPTVKQTIDEVRAVVQLRIYQERMAREYDEWVRGLVERARVRVDEAALDEVQARP